MQQRDGAQDYDEEDEQKEDEEEEVVKHEVEDQVQEKAKNTNFYEVSPRVDCEK